MLRGTGRLAYADSRMKDFLLTLLDLAVTIAKLGRPGGVRAVIAENLVLKQQLIVLRRGRRRAPSLSLRDRLVCAVGSLFFSPGRLRNGRHRPPPLNTPGVSSGLSASQVPPAVLVNVVPEEVRTEKGPTRHSSKKSSSSSRAILGSGAPGSR